jgi:Asp-tRNA(Asn)/Glu-tRNA(Gln) amidotransferase C subunit
LVDIQTLARVALQSGDKAVMTRDLEMIITIVEMVLPLKH